MKTETIIFKPIKEHIFSYMCKADGRGVARIFSEVRTILQITLHQHPPPPQKKKTSLIKIWLHCKPKSFFSVYEMTLATY